MTMASACSAPRSAAARSLPDFSAKPIFFSGSVFFLRLLYISVKLYSPLPSVSTV